MPQSRKRGGKKAHNKRVKVRNEKLAQDRKKMNKLYAEMMEQKLKEFQEKFSGMTENEETLNFENTTQEVIVEEVKEQPIEDEISDLEK
jgi:hypothetical protein